MRIIQVNDNKPFFLLWWDSEKYEVKILHEDDIKVVDAVIAMAMYEDCESISIGSNFSGFKTVSRENLNEWEETKGYLMR